MRVDSRTPFHTSQVRSLVMSRVDDSLTGKAKQQAEAMICSRFESQLPASAVFSVWRWVYRQTIGRVT